MKFLVTEMKDFFNTPINFYNTLITFKPLKPGIKCQTGSDLNVTWRMTFTGSRLEGLRNLNFLFIRIRHYTHLEYCEVLEFI